MLNRILCFCAFALAATLGVPIGAQETRVGEEGFESPPASLEQMDWLVGQWSGEGIGGEPAMESWLPPSGPTMVGTFVQQTAGEDGAPEIMFTEHMYLMEEEGTLVLRLKHFNADLSGWEEKDGMLAFRLVAIEPCAAYFHALTLRCDGEDGLLAAVRMQAAGDEVNELIFRFERQERQSEAASIGDLDCSDQTTRGYEECFANRGARIVERHQRYLAAAREQYADSADVLTEIEKSEAAFEAYSQAECGAVYATFGNGSIRNAEWILCTSDLRRRRTHTIWRNFLTYPDSTPPVLPEPSLEY